MTARTLALTALLTGVLAAPAGAADFVVTATHDDGDGVCSDAPNNCTLRDAITEAGPSDVVRLPRGVYELVEGELTLAGDTVVGAGARNTVIDALGVSRVFHATTGINVVSGVTMTGGGTSSGQVFTRTGGAVLVRNASLAVVESAVIASEAMNGGGLANSGGTLTIFRSTISGNVASAATSGAQGGGIFSAGTTYLRNSTVSGNTADTGEAFDATGGGIYLAGGTFVSQSSTIANNQSVGGVDSDPTPGSALAGHQLTNTNTTLSHTIIGDNGPLACSNAPFSGTHNVLDDQVCGIVESPFLGALANNGGATDTHSISADSDAVDEGNACEPADQRGLARVNSCDVGAYEAFATDAAPAVLWVVTEVVNDSGGTLAPGQVSVHVRLDGVDDDESPQPGDRTGRSYTIEDDITHVVSASASGYTTTVGGHCAPDGTVAMQLSETQLCTVRLDDVAGSQPPQVGGGGGGGTTQPSPGEGEQQLPPPEAGKAVNALPKSGTVRVKIAGTNRFVELMEGQLIPVGSVIDTTKGRVTIVAAGGQQADFYDGIFRLTQGKGAKPLTTLTLVEKLTCPKAGRAVAAAKKKRRLWGDGSGRFRTKGKHSAATVVGTKWLVEDKCSSTLTRVTRGRVSVRDFVKRKTVIVRAGKKYVARAKKP